MVNFAGVLVLLTFDNVVAQALANFVFPEITNMMKKPVYEKNLLRTNRFMCFMVFMMISYGFCGNYQAFIVIPEIMEKNQKPNAK